MANVKIDELKEMTRDLIENHPISYAFNCDLKLEALEYRLDRLNLNTFFKDSIDCNFELKCLKRKPANKYNDTAVYEVELFENESKKSFIDYYLASNDISLNETDTTKVTSIVDATHVTFDDKAIADNYSHNQMDNTSYMRENATNADNDSKFNFSEMPSEMASVIEPSQNFAKSPKYIPNLSGAKISEFSIGPSAISKNYNKPHTQVQIQTDRLSATLPHLKTLEVNTNLRIHLNESSMVSPQNVNESISNSNNPINKPLRSVTDSYSDWTKTPPQLKGVTVLPLEAISNLSVSSFEKLQDPLTAKKNSMPATQPEYKGVPILPAEVTSNMSVSTFEKIVDKKLDSWSATPPEKKNYQGLENTLRRADLNETDQEVKSQNKTVEPSFSTTPPHLKNYNHVEITLNQTNMTNADQTNISCTNQVNNLYEDSIPDLTNVSINEFNKAANNENDSTLTEENKKDTSVYFDSRTEANFCKQNETNDETYSTCEEESTLNHTSGDEVIILKNCLVSLIDESSKKLFIQMEDFEERISKIQPIIDDAIEPYDEALSNLCIAQFKEDEKFYRCQMLNWGAEEGQDAFCYFMDFGNVDYVSKDSVTEMSKELCLEKPFALICQLYSNFDSNPEEFKQLTHLVEKEVRFDVMIGVKELKVFYASKDYYNSIPISIELFASKNNQKVTIETLKDKNIWDELLANNEMDQSEPVDYLNEISIKQEPVSIIIEYTTKDNDETQSNNDTLAKKYVKESCQDEVSSNKNRNQKKDDDDDDDNDDDDDSTNEVFYAQSSKVTLPSAKSESKSSSSQSNGGVSGGAKDQAQSENSKMCAKLVQELIDEADISKIQDKKQCKKSDETVEEYADKSVNWSLDKSKQDLEKNLVVFAESNVLEQHINMDATDNFRNESTDWSGDETSISYMSPNLEKDKKSQDYQKKELKIKNQSEILENNDSINTSKTIEHKNKDASKFHDQSQDWDKSAANLSPDSSHLSSVNKTDLHTNKDVSKFHDQSQDWDKSVANLNADSSHLSSVNKTDLHTNKDVSKFHDQSQDWDKSAANLNPDTSHLSNGNKTEFHTNKDVSKFHDQSQDWDKSVANLNADSSHLSSVNKTDLHTNKDVSKFHDQSQDWDKSAANLNPDTSHLSNGNKTEMHTNKDVSRFHDQSTCWEGNDSCLNNDMTRVHRNKTVSKFHDDSSQWTVNDNGENTSTNLKFRLKAFLKMTEI
jgi:hypothetical protein